MYSPDAKFEEHRFNISRDIRNWVLLSFSEPPMKTSLYTQKRNYLQNETRCSKKKISILLYFERPFK